MLNRDGIPLYQQLYERCKQKIMSGEWKENQYIPPETSLMKQYGIGRETVRRAITKLVQEGYLIRQHGRGTLVYRSYPRTEGEKYYSFTSEILARGYRPSTEVLHTDERLAPKHVQMTLRVPENEPMLYCKRLRYINEQPVAVEETYIIIKQVGPVESHKLSGSLYDYFVLEKGIKPGNLIQDIRAIMPDSHVVKLLEIQEKVPLLELIRVVNNHRGEPLLYTLFLCRGDRYSVRNEIDLP